LTAHFPYFIKCRVFVIYYIGLLIGLFKIKLYFNVKGRMHIAKLAINVTY